MARYTALLGLAAGAAAQLMAPQPFFATARVEFRVDDSVVEAGDLEQALGLAAPSLAAPGLVVGRRGEGSAPPLPTSLLSLLGGFPGFAAFPPATTEYVVRTFDDDDAAEVESSPHDFGCPCGQDVAASCPDTADDGEDAFRSVFEKRLCLANAERLSPRCAAHLQAYPTVVEWCARDISRNCADVAPGDNRVHACLAALPALESECADYLAAVSPVAGLEARARAEEAEALGATVAGLAGQAFKAFELVDAMMRRVVASQPAAEAQDDAPSDEWLAFDEAAAPRPSLENDMVLPRDLPRLEREATLSRLGPRLHQSEIEGPRKFLGADGHGVYQGPEPRHHVGADGHGVYRGDRQEHVRSGDGKYYALESDGVDINGTPEKKKGPPKPEGPKPVNSARATKLAALLLAVGMASGLLASILLVAVVRTYLRKKHEREAAEEFKQKFAPLLAEAPLDKV